MSRRDSWRSNPKSQNDNLFVSDSPNSCYSALSRNDERAPQKRVQEGRRFGVAVRRPWLDGVVGPKIRAPGADVRLDLDKILKGQSARIFPIELAINP